MNYQIKIKELREQNGLSQEELSEASGVSLRTIQRIENEECTPRESTLNAIAESLNVTTDYLINNPLEVITEEPEIDNRLSKKRRGFAWYRFSLTVIGGSLGFILGLLIIEGHFTERVDDSLFVLPLTILFGVIGLLSGNYFDKRNS